MKYILFVFLSFSIFCCKTNSQVPTKTLVHLFENNQNELKYMFKYEMDSEGKNTIDRTEFKNLLTIRKIEQIGDTLTLEINSDSTQTSNKRTLQDGDAALFFAMIGLNMKVKITNNGELIEILNKEALIKEFEEGIIGLSKEGRKEIVQNMVKENEELLYSKFYEVNYVPILKHIGKTIIVPFRNEKDSIIQATLDQPLMKINTIKESQDSSNFVRSKITTFTETEAFTKDEGNYVIENLASNSHSEELIIIGKSGQINQVVINSTQKYNGFKIKLDGKVMQEMEPIIQYSKIEISLVK